MTYGVPTLPDFTERSPRLATLVGWPVNLLLILALLYLLMLDPPPRHGVNAVFALGAVGIWRWSWAILHFIRGAIFRRLVFPRIRRQAAAAPKPVHLYMLVTSYHMSAELNAAVYKRVFEEVRDYGVAATVVACITDPADVTVLEAIFRHVGGLPEGTSLIFSPQRGRGKRDAMARALVEIGRGQPLPGSLVVLMDGDTVLGSGALALTCQVMAADPRLGAATTENIPLVRGSTLTREWYRLRMAQRDNLMCSLALSRKLLVLTGRFSVFRAEIAADPEFALALENDTVQHWRFGRLKMVTGDDKSTWYLVLRRGWDMLYVPDAVIYPMEELPAGSFPAATRALMVRWFGNMVRNSSRAIRLGPRAVGLFPWWCFVDQRLSMWTPLIGPISILTLTVLQGTGFLWAYLLWIYVSRTVMCAALWAATGRLHPIFPLLLYYTQITSAVLKIVMTFHPYRQRWTRQAVGAGVSDPETALRDFTSGVLNVLFVALFVSVVVLFVIT
ncbi:glycosyltransferase [Pseudoxanthobacter sp.]|uniref:glycosyltransferase n=1 Tax=Pseudoxanthobacter sp. TaxID=1925742 RepID=UPI002FE1BC2B